MKSNSHQLLAFARVMREGSFSAAADKLGVTQSALSQHVKKLEQSVGSQVLIRGPNGLELTRVGAEVFELAEQFASLSKEIDDRLLGYSNFDTGFLNIAANAPQPALTSIARYGHSYPNVEISFSLFDWTRTMAMLTDHSVDIAFVTQPRFLNNCIYKKLCETTYVLYAKADHPLAHFSSVPLSALAAETLILPEKGSLTQKVVSKALRLNAVEPRRSLITTSFPVMKDAILHGIGVGIFLADAATRTDGLKQIKIDDLDEVFEIHAAVPKHKARFRLVRTFWDELSGVQTHFQNLA